ncbi:uncharacterized protein LOC112198720 [Rosa chinensis]|uniref:uncharacterized protein LOC112198720 n=1 Tax=Rosa chinensis TaxID=74649 RepID=UPI000D08F881|nr:uncharacterized protein LOC112198720 [Rosa chinensis]
MDCDRGRSGSINCPPYFDGEDFAQWKTMMQAFLHAQDEHIWNIVETGWELPITKTKLDATESSATITELKPRDEWSTSEVHDYNNDVKARHSFYTALFKKEGKRIGTCKTAKKTWDLLQMTYEGDPIAEHRIVKKFLRSLPASFMSKQTAIEGVQDLETYSLDELLGNLQTFEMKIKPVKNKKENDFEFTSKDFALLSKQYKKFLRVGHSFQEVKNSLGSSSRKNSFSENPKCLECQGFGHLAIDCGNMKYKARTSKAMKSTWSDSENEEQNFALTATLHSTSSSDSDDDEHNNEEMADKYEEMGRTSSKMIKINEELNKKLILAEKERNGIAEHLQSHAENWEIEKAAYVDHIKTLQESLDAQVSLVNSLSSEKLSVEHSLKESQEMFSKFSIGSEKVSKMIGIEKTEGDKKGLGNSSCIASEKSKPIRFVKETMVPKTENSSNLRRFILVCHHCGTPGHIRPKCNKFRKNFQKVRPPQRSMHNQFFEAKLREHLREVNRIANLGKEG